MSVAEDLMPLTRTTEGTRRGCVDHTHLALRRCLRETTQSWCVYGFYNRLPARRSGRRGMELKHTLHTPRMHHHRMREVRHAIHHDAHRFASCEALWKMRRLEKSLGVERKALSNLTVVGKARTLAVLTARPSTSVKGGDHHETVDVVRRRRAVRNTTHFAATVVGKLATVAHPPVELWDTSRVRANATLGTHVSCLTASNVPAMVAHVRV